MTCEKKRSGFQITSVTSDFNQPWTGPSAPGVILTVVQSKSAFHSARGSSSQPTTPSPKRRHISHDPLGQGTGASSRFRLVRLVGGAAAGQGHGDTYGRGRWLCTEFKEGPGLKRVMDNMRHAHSLESLESISGGVCLPSQPITNKQTQERLVPSQPSPLHLGTHPKNRSVLRLSRSQPSSPPTTLTLIPTRTALGLDQNAAFSLPADISVVAIDNKIEQAMDLVKSHLMLAVREEVELLREQIRELQERNQQLEAENHTLRKQAHSDPRPTSPAAPPTG
ncbi:sperm acrosome developmental regulator-like [Corythoichthys intestinalis]|uniref:sperm acrosome developmental regulator-like n=1 Tax=Corythoichthys intestinalis TaxID=161448 RepID=UPI0025A66BE4|nr:sperm acrosome developmental regulator-like [Corythoichthys intestinalis]XP_057712332.1 sperm acrosome developmental regulator-like [Corythoichthys intestinalis]XP_057712333.1 sperm acrosome developmental regulator-like [Corythoichthys intestinalis]